MTILKTGNEKTKFKLFTKKTFHTIRDNAASFNFFKFNGMLYIKQNWLEKMVYNFLTLYHNFFYKF